jgi:hypothetical protein
MTQRQASTSMDMHRSMELKSELCRNADIVSAARLFVHVLWGSRSRGFVFEIVVVATAVECICAGHYATSALLR